MWQFLQTYGIWIVLGVVFILMMRMCGGGMHGSRGGCGMGMDQNHDQNEEQAKAPRVVPFHHEGRDDQRMLPPEAAYSEAERRIWCMASTLKLSVKHWCEMFPCVRKVRLLTATLLIAVREAVNSMCQRQFIYSPIRPFMSHP